MKILFLTDNFPPEVNAPASRTFEHCREWAKADHDITVVTCAPNYPKGKLLDGYSNKLRQVETIEGIKVVRVWSYIAANQGVARRTLDYLSYMLSSIVASVFLPRPDVIVATSPQFFTACAGYAVSRIKRTPWVFELRDLWPESIEAVGAMKVNPVLRMFGKLEAFLYRKADAIVSVTNSFKTILTGRGVAAEKIHVVTNGVDRIKFRPIPRDPELSRALQCEGKTVAGYIGTHGMAHGLATLLDAAEILARQPDGADIVFLLVGDGAEKKQLQADAATRGLTNVRFVDTVSKQEIVRYWSLLDFSVIHLRKTELFTSVIPSKMFESMAMGVPIMHGVEGESADIVRETQTGMCFEPGNAHALAELLLRARRDENLALFRTNCEQGARLYDRPALAAKMLTVLEGVARRPQIAATRTRRMPAE